MKFFNDIKAKEVLKTPNSKHEIEEAKAEESQMRVFTEVLRQNGVNKEQYFQLLMRTMSERAEKKFDRVSQFFRFPLPVVEITDSILSDYYKVFDGKNRYFNVSSSRQIPILKDWIKETKPSLWIEKHAHKVFKNSPNSFVVVDADKNGMPYLVYVDSERLIDAKFKDSEGHLEYIAFVHSQNNEDGILKTLYSVYDDENYYVFEKDHDKDEYKTVKTVAHGLGFCPAKSFIRTATETDNLFKRRVAFSSALSKLEDWTMFDVFRNYVDYYAPFPITEAPVKKCANSECHDGKIPEETIDPDNRNNTVTNWRTCPVCDGGQDGAQIFPGTHIGIKVQSDKSINDGSGVFKMIFPDTDKMEYVPKKLDDLELEIKHKTVGVNSIVNAEAVNEMQMQGSFASMESVLLRTKTELDVLYKWIVETVGKVIYGDISFSVEANFGTEFYLASEEDLQRRFANAKKIGLPAEEQANIYRQLIETKYKGNTEKLQKELMLLDLDPLPMYSVEECIKLKNESVLDDFQLSLKVNFLKFISKFEAENIEITKFGLALPYWSRVEKIENELFVYNQELIDLKQERAKKNEDLQTIKNQNNEIETE